MHAAVSGQEKEGLTFDRPSALRTRSDIGMLYATPQAETIDQALGMRRYDTIVLLGDVRRMRGEGSIRTCLRVHLAEESTLYFTDIV